MKPWEKQNAWLSSSKAVAISSYIFQWQGKTEIQGIRTHQEMLALTLFSGPGVDMDMSYICLELMLQAIYQIALMTADAGVCGRGVAPLADPSHRQGAAKADVHRAHAGGRSEAGGLPNAVARARRLPAAARELQSGGLPPHIFQRTGPAHEGPSFGC